MVDDEPALVRVLSIALEARGYGVTVAKTGQAAAEQAAVVEPDLIILDLGLPDVDGIRLCASLRSWYRNPIVVVTADGLQDRKIAALDAGADDYVTKPFSTGELLARIRVGLRHRQTIEAVVDPVTVRVGDLFIDVAAHQVSIGGVEVEMTPKEFRLLTLLARNRGRVLTHGVLLSHVWQGRPGTTQSLRVHVNQLRGKLGGGPARPRLVTEPGVGYRLLEPGVDLDA